MKYLDEYRDGAAAREAGGGDRADRDAALDDHGGLRRPDAHDRQVRDRPDPAAGASSWCTGRAVRSASPRSRRSTAPTRSPRGPEVIFCSFGDMLRVPGSRGDLLQLKSQGSRRPDRLFAARRREPRRRQPRPQGRLLRHRLRDDRAAQRDGRLAGPQAEAGELQRAGLARAGAAGDRPRSSNAPGQPGAGRSSGPGHVCTVMGYDEYEPLAAPLPRADRGHRLRAARPARGRPAGRSGSSRTGRAEVENAYGRAVRPEGNPAVAAADRGRLRGLRPQVAGHRPDPAERLQAPRTSIATTTPSGSSRSRTSRPRNRRSASAARSSKGLKKPHDCPAFGRECTPQTPAGRDDGLVRRGLRRLLRLRPASRGCWPRADFRMSEPRSMSSSGERRPSRIAEDGAP